MRGSYYKRYFSGSFQNSHTYASYRDDTKSYIRSEFFKLDKFSFQRVAATYRSLYGEKAYEYLLSTVHLWQSGNRKMSDQTVERLLMCVPKYLPEDKKQFILKSEIVKFITAEQAKYNNKTYNFTHIDTIYTDLFKRVNQFSRDNLRWFAKDVFSINEINTFIEISKYVIKRKIEQSYQEVKNDFQLLIPIVQNINVGIKRRSYRIDFFNCDIIIDVYFDLSKMKLGNKGVPMPHLNGTISGKNLSYLVDEIINLTFVGQANKIDQVISKNDLHLLYVKYHKLLESDLDSEINSNFKGKGGVFSISIILKSLRNLKQKQFLYALQSMALVVLFVGPWYFTIRYKYYDHNILIVIASVVLMATAYSQLKKYKSIKMEAEIYEREQESAKKN